MIDIQNHIRNEGLLNLFDGRSVAPKPKFDNKWIVVSAPRQCGKSWFAEEYRRKPDDLGDAVARKYARKS